LENFMSGEQVSMLCWYSVIIEENITCTAIICQFDLCYTVTCLRHYTHLQSVHVQSQTQYTIQ
jgi:hypothetical protein